MGKLLPMFASWLRERAKKKEFTLCGHCYGDSRGECIRVNRCIGEGVRHG